MVDERLEIGDVGDFGDVGGRLEVGDVGEEGEEFDIKCSCVEALK